MVYYSNFKWYVAQFAEQNDMEAEDIESQWDVVEEEIDELLEAWDEYQTLINQPYDGNGYKPTNEFKEEITDVLFTLFLVCELLDIDIEKEYVEKSKHNLKKSGKRDENGKIIDDVEGE